VTPGSLDEKGREIDEEGNLVKVDLSDLRTVKANIAGKDDKKKKEPENPYLAYSRPDEVRGDRGPKGYTRECRMVDLSGGQDGVVGLC
jgi:hypothetical protein